MYQLENVINIHGATTRVRTGNPDERADMRAISSAIWRGHIIYNQNVSRMHAPCGPGLIPASAVGMRCLKHVLDFVHVGDDLFKSQLRDITEITV